MNDPETHSDAAPGKSRRDFLRDVAVIAGVASLGVPANAAGSPGAAAAEAIPSGYLSLGPDEAAFVEALVDVMCPADHLTPRGVECGLALFIDRQLAGPFGKGERLYRRGPWRTGPRENGFQLPLTPEQFFKVGLEAADREAVRRHGKRFPELPAADADAFLGAVSSGKFDNARVSLSEWFDELVYPLFAQACFADPIYGGNRGKVFWQMLGYPGLPAVNGLNMAKYRGKPFPGASSPKSIEDFS